MSVTYRITETNETSTSGDGGAPTSSERSYTVEAIGGRGNYTDASTQFFQYAKSNCASDPWGNPISNISLQENSESLGRLWEGTINWELPSASESAANDAYDAYEATGTSSGDNTSTGDSIRWYPYVSAFSIAGGTKHVAVSNYTRAYPINGVPINFGGGIGWNGEGFEGVDVPCAAINFEVTARTPEGFIGRFARFLDQILPYVGTVNAYKFYGCAPGTVRFDGITSGSLKQGTSSSGAKFSYWEMTFAFSAMPNEIANVDGVPVPKSGWEYMWHLADENGTIQATYVEGVFPQSDFKGLGIGGNF